MSQGPPVIPLVVVGVPLQALVPAPPVPVEPPLPVVAPPEPPVEEAAASDASEVILQPKQETPSKATRETSFQKLLVLIWIGRIVRRDESC
jgi:hypothetical protein